MMYHATTTLTLTGPLSRSLGFRVNTLRLSLESAAHNSSVNRTLTRCAGSRRLPQALGGCINISDSMISFVRNPALDDETLNSLFAASWSNHRPRSFVNVLERSLCFFGAFDGDPLVGFVNVATDGGAHAFLLNPTVHPAYRRHGLGTRLVAAAIDAAKGARCQWLHVDFETHLASFYDACGFTPTHAGLISLAASPNDR